MAQVSAGVLLFRRTGAGIECLIAHPGGPYFARKDEGSWSIPKGLLDEGEEMEAAARREWEEETGLALPDGEWTSLGDTTLRSGKRVVAWAVEGDVDVAGFTGNTFDLEWPPRSGRIQAFPEVDELRWVKPAEARRLLNPAQVVFVEQILKNLGINADT